jgi:DNA-directed RNA polymerase subunit RPC12/RpoP
MVSDEPESKRLIFINLEEVHCPKCGTRMPALRVPEGLHQLMWGGWTCPQCGCRMDKWGKAIESEAE